MATILTYVAPITSAATRCVICSRAGRKVGAEPTQHSLVADTTGVTQYQKMCTCTKKSAFKWNVLVCRCIGLID